MLIAFGHNGMPPTWLCIVWLIAVLTSPLWLWLLSGLGSGDIPGGGMNESDIERRRQIREYERRSRD